MKGCGRSQYRMSVNLGHPAGHAHFFQVLIVVSEGREDIGTITITRIYILRWRSRCRRRRRCLSSLLISPKLVRLFGKVAIFQKFSFNLSKSAPTRESPICFRHMGRKQNVMRSSCNFILFCAYNFKQLTKIFEFLGATRAFRFADHVTKRNGGL